MLKQLCLGSMSRKSSALVLAMLCGCGSLADTDEEADVAAQESAGLDGGIVTPASRDGGSRFPGIDGGFQLPTRPRDAGVDAGPPNVVALTDADGGTIGQVTASGRGCPLGTWDVKMSEDQLTYTATFKSLDITLGASQEVASASCTLSIAPPSDGTRQFSAKSASFTAKGRFDEGVVGALELRHFTQGTAANTVPAHAYEGGPFEGALSIERQVGASEARWTPCSVPQRGVNVDLLLRLSNGVPRTTGSLVSDADSKLVITLSSRACPQRAELDPDAGV
ncbi:MAG: DUF4360 domain-containing protein [Polyangiales bacterium]